MSYIKRKSRKQEERTAKELGGRTVVASGAMWAAKGDVRTDDYLIENKYTDKDYYSLKWSIWEKITKEAIKDNFRVPIMQIDIKDHSYIVIEDCNLMADYLDVGDSVSTDKKSYRLNNAELMESREKGELFRLEFKAAKKALYVLNKDLFLGL